MLEKKDYSKRLNLYMRKIYFDLSCNKLDFLSIRYKHL